MSLVFVDQEKNTNIAVVLYKKNIAKKPANPKTLAEYRRDGKSLHRATVMMLTNRRNDASENQK